MDQMQKVIELGRVIRERKSKPLKQPLRQLTIVHPDTAVLHSLKGELSEYIYQEVNVRDLATCSNPQKFGSLRAEPIFAVILLPLDMQPTRFCLQVYQASFTCLYPFLHIYEGPLQFFCQASNMQRNKAELHHKIGEI